MGSYHSSFSYLGQNLRDYNLIISRFDSDVGEMETGLATESIYTSSYDGTKRNLYGTKYSSPEPLVITIIKLNGEEFSMDETRKILRWLTGAKTDSWLDLYIGDEVKYRLLGHVQNIRQYKFDSRIIGFVITFESASPFAYSSLQHYPAEENTWYPVNGEENTIEINNESDDIYSYVYLNTTFKNSIGESLKITNTSLEDETTEVYNLVENEVITISNNMMITSDNDVRVFGNSFNFVFPRLQPGLNTFNISGYGEIQFEYIYPIKVGECISTMNSIQDSVCDPETGEIVIDKLHWSRIVGTPNTLAGYGITDTYTAKQIDEKIANVQVGSVSWNNITQKPELYTKTEIDDKLKNLDVDIDLTNYYTKSEVDSLLSSAQLEIDETELNNMLTEVLV